MLAVAPRLGSGQRGAGSAMVLTLDPPHQLSGGRLQTPQDVRLDKRRIHLGHVVKGESAELDHPAAHLRDVLERDQFAGLVEQRRIIVSGCIGSRSYTHTTYTTACIQQGQGV